jgi:Putative motility protein
VPRGLGYSRMDMSLVAAVLAAQAGAVQQQVANSVLKSNLDTEKSTVLTLLGAGQQTLSLGNVGPGVGGNLNIAA